MMTQPDKTVFPESYWQIARLHRKCKFWVSCLVLNACRTAHCAVIFSFFPLCLFLRTGGLGINGFTKRRVTLLFCSSHEVYLRSGCPLNVSVWVDVSMCFREAGVGWGGSGGRNNVGCSQAPSERSWGGGVRSGWEERWREELPRGSECQRWEMIRERVCEATHSLCNYVCTELWRLKCQPCGSSLRDDFMVWLWKSVDSLKYNYNYTKGVQYNLSKGGMTI